jgi:hypothetical protein
MTRPKSAAKWTREVARVPIANPRLAGTSGLGGSGFFRREWASPFDSRDTNLGARAGGFSESIAKAQHTYLVKTKNSEKLVESRKLPRSRNRLTRYPDMMGYSKFPGVTESWPKDHQMKGLRKSKSLKLLKLDLINNPGFLGKSSSSRSLKYDDSALRAGRSPTRRMRTLPLSSPKPSRHNRVPDFTLGVVHNNFTDEESGLYDHPLE